MSIEKAYIQKFMNESNAKHEDNPYEKEWEEYRTGVKGSFMKYLALAFQQADTKNIIKLQSAFPEVGKIFALWKTNGAQDSFEAVSELNENESKTKASCLTRRQEKFEEHSNLKYFNDRHGTRGYDFDYAPGKRVGFYEQSPEITGESKPEYMVIFSDDELEDVTQDVLAEYDLEEEGFGTNFSIVADTLRTIMTDKGFSKEAEKMIRGMQARM